MEKDNITSSFLTSLISKNWDEISVLKDTIAMINNTEENNFTDREEIIKVLEDLSDSYLLAIGKLEYILHSNDLIKTAAEAKTDDQEVPVAEITVTEEPKEETQVEEETLEEGYIKRDYKTGKTYCSVDGKSWEECSEEEFYELDKNGHYIELEDGELPEEEEEETEQFEYFCDFEDPEI